jgi:hypothetical protein
VTTQGAERTAATPGSARLWLPATVIDELVRTRLREFLTDKTLISLLLREARCRPAQIGGGLTIATELANSLTSGLPAAQSAAELIARVTASHASLSISIKRGQLLAILTDTTVEQFRNDAQANIISLKVTVPAAPDRGSGKLVLEDQNAKTPDAVVVKAIARASIWFEQLTAGKSRSMAEIAVREGITDNYVSHLIHLAWLSPDLVSRVLEGVIRRRLRWRGPRCSLATPTLYGIDNNPTELPIG